MKHRKVLIASLVIAASVFLLLSDFFQPDAEIPNADASTLRYTTKGKVLGFSDTPDSHAWLGIPFARPPVGELRWRAPQTSESWAGTRQALSVGNFCPQLGSPLGVEDKSTFGKLVGSEDCLYLNIWAPAWKPDQVPSGSKRLPVMVWIHGGGNSLGHGGTPIYNGSAQVISQDVVFVAINYRLGPFGWFTHPALRQENNSQEDSSGNYGTLDIIQSLRWVQENISEFGGDPNNVTIYGESAGAMNVLTMMASPLAKGLYHRAISQSGFKLVTKVTEGENYVDDPIPGHSSSSREMINQLLIRDEKAKDRLGAKRIQEEMSDDAIASYLRNKPYADIFNTYDVSRSSMLDIPVLFVDGYVLPKNFLDADFFSDTDNYNVTPVIIGTNRDEEKLFRFLDGRSINSILGIPWSFNDEVAYERASRYITDSWKAQGVDNIASQLTRAEGDSVYAYRFDWDEQRSIFGFELSKALGAAHGLEIPFVFGNFDSLFSKNDDEAGIPAREKLSESMMSYWSEFVYHGNPGKGRNGKEVAWTAWTNGDLENPRLLILDGERDQGIRMSNEWLTMEQVKSRFLSDDSFTNQEEYCLAYREFFVNTRLKSSEASEYANLGQGGCQDILD